MTKLSDQEKQAWREAAKHPIRQPPLRPDERFVAPTPEARSRYIRFATQAAAFYKGAKPVRFRGNDWRL